MNPSSAESPPPSVSADTAIAQQALPNGTTPSHSPFTTYLTKSLLLLNSSVSRKDARFTLRALRLLPQLRKSFSFSHHCELVNALLLKLNLNTQNASRTKGVDEFIAVAKSINNNVTFHKDVVSTVPVEEKALKSSRSFLGAILGSFVSVATAHSNGNLTSTEINQFREKCDLNILKECLPELEIFLALLVLINHIDRKFYQEAKFVADALIERLKLYNRRSLDMLVAKVYFYYSRSYELTNSLSVIRQELLTAYRKACIHHDTYSQATMLNLLLRNYLHYNLFELALKLANKTVFVENLRSNAQYARYLYYIGRIQAVQLEYTESYNKLMQAVRKAPQGGKTARGFRLAATKMAIVVELLIGDIPDRSTFNQKDLQRDLLPYMDIVLAVRSGDLHAFSSVLSHYENQFSKDGTLFLIHRLHHSVIRAGLRMINVSYSRITLEDISKKLGLDSVADIECIVSKAIFDGVIEAQIHHDQKFVEFKSQSDIYGTNEPMKAFTRRIAFCLQLYSDAVKAMQYPDSSAKEKLAKAEARRAAEESTRLDEDALNDDLDLL